MAPNKNIYNLLKLVQTSHNFANKKFQLPILSTEIVTNWLIENSMNYKEIKGLETFDQLLKININESEINYLLVSRAILGSSSQYLLGNYSTWNLLEIYHLNYTILIQNCPTSTEIDFLNLCGYDELLDAYESNMYFGLPENATELGRLKALLNPFMYFLKYIYEDFTINNFINWDKLNDKVENKLNFIKQKGQEIGDKYNVYKFKDYEPFKS